MLINVHSEIFVMIGDLKMGIIITSKRTDWQNFPQNELYIILIIFILLNSIIQAEYWFMESKTNPTCEYMQNNFISMTE